MTAARQGSGSAVNAPLEQGFPVYRDRIREDVPIAKRAVIIHRPEAWPDGQYCRNDGWPWPCGLHRWGSTVLQSVGWPEAEVAELVRRAAAGELPWAKP